jgi:twitching motility protein PilT
LYEPDQNQAPPAATATATVAPRPASGLVSIEELLTQLVKRDGSDLHLKVDEPPIFRINGKLTRTEFSVLTDADTKNILGPILTDAQKKSLLENRELDLAHSVPGLARFRVNVFFQNKRLGAVIRVIPIRIKTSEELGLPESTNKFAELSRGLVLVTGPTGSGKSTTLAAIIDRINSSRKVHIITIEDPIEFLHKDKMAAINQRELGSDTHSFAEALKHVTRQNPDVILVGEMRDLETISLAMTAAETGHLVFGTLHTADSAQTIDRIVDVFSPEHQPRVRMQLANSLRGVVSQTLLRRIEGGRVAAFELLICHSGVRNLIREGKTHQIYNLIQTGGAYGMELLDKNLKRLVEDKVVDFQDAIAKASNPTEFEKLAATLGVTY